MDIAYVAAQIWPFIGAAVGAYGSAVIDKATDAGADETVSLGRRLLQRIWRREASRPYLRRALEGMASAPDDKDAAAALRQEIRRVLAEDHELARSVAELLSEAPAGRESYEASGKGSVVVRDNHGIISTGADASIQW